MNVAILDQTKNIISRSTMKREWTCSKTIKIMKSTCQGQGIINIIILNKIPAMIETIFGDMKLQLKSQEMKVNLRLFCKSRAKRKKHGKTIPNRAKKFNSEKGKELFRYIRHRDRNDS